MMLATAAGNLASARTLMAAGATPFHRGACAWEVALLTCRLQFVRPYLLQLPPPWRWDWGYVNAVFSVLISHSIWAPAYYLSTNGSFLDHSGHELLSLVDFLCPQFLILLAHLLPFLLWLWYRLQPFPWGVIWGALLSLAAPVSGAVLAGHALLTQSSPPAASYAVTAATAAGFAVIVAIPLAVVRLLLSVPLRRVLWSRRVRPGIVWHLLAKSYVSWEA
jgi:hypothetical protein